ncbi:MAG: ABC transporter substrate-binding protein [Candidatus Caldarchaeum sp.]|nr:ABC transporter substrate-binding protein [Candidatus Caldarchaeum sp.]MDW8434670.1 ABC transporter substrate-binding protein [Candidatus Caldarchaeum sp.]
MKARAYASVFLLLTFLLLSAGAQQYSPPHSKPGPAADVIRVRAYAEEVAPQALERGDIDIYLYSMRVSRLQALENRPDISMVRAPSLLLSLILNPAPDPRGLNPFSIKEVRQAFQYLVNREYVSRELYRGLASPMVTILTPYDYDYAQFFNTVLGTGIRYDPEYANRIISNALTAAGAVKRDGKWFFRDTPISLKFVIRTEDERREIGDLVASELEKAGFSVERIYLPFAQAIARVYTTDPQEFTWHIYTEGWGRGALEKYDSTSINQFCAPWLGNMPGWQEFGYWQYSNQLLDELGQRIFKGQYSGREERNTLYLRALRECVSESVRVWVAVVMQSTPLSKKIQGVTEDLAAGARGIWTLRETHVPGREILNIGHLWVWTPRTVWNPVGGFGDVYSADLWRAVADPSLTRHPFTGLPIPFRASYTVETAGPTGTLSVPSDAFTWDAASKSWKTVPSGTRAISKVTFDYRQYTASKWHHGIPITMADVLYRIHQSFDIAYDETKSRIEFALAFTSRPVLETFKGFRILDDSRLEVYVDYWNFEKDYIAEYADVFGGGMPWELLAASDDLVFTRRLVAYSDTAAARFRVDQLNLVLREQVSLVRLALNDFMAKNFFPSNVFTVGGKAYETRENAMARYRALLNWINTYNLAVVSNGPYYLAVFDPASQYAELRAFRDPSYPFKPGKWYFGTVDKPRIQKVEGTISPGSDAVITINTAGPADVAVTYFIKDPATGQTLESGVAKPTAGAVRITLPAAKTAGLSPGFIELVAVAYSEQVATAFNFVEKIEVRRPTTTVTTPRTTVVTTPAAPEQPPPPTWLIIALAGVAAVAVAAALLLRRR